MCPETLQISQTGRKTNQYLTPQHSYFCEIIAAIQMRDQCFIAFSIEVLHQSRTPLMTLSAEGQDRESLENTTQAVVSYPS